MSSIFARFLYRVDPILNCMAKIQDLVRWKSFLHSVLLLVTWTLICWFPSIAWLLAPPLLLSWVGTQLNHHRLRRHFRSYNKAPMPWSETAIVMIRLTLVLEEMDKILDNWYACNDFWCLYSTSTMIMIPLVAWIAIQCILPVHIQCWLGGTLIFSWHNQWFQNLLQSLRFFLQHQNEEQNLTLQHAHSDGQVIIHPSRQPQEFYRHEKKEVTSRSNNTRYLPSPSAVYNETVIVEHQRYWFGVGWLHEMLPGDPLPWTMMDGRPLNRRITIDEDWIAGTWTCHGWIRRRQWLRHGAVSMDRVNQSDVIDREIGLKQLR